MLSGNTGRSENVLQSLHTEVSPVFSERDKTAEKKLQGLISGSWSKLRTGKNFFADL